VTCAGHVHDMRAGSLFSGCGLLDYGLTLAGFDHSWLCERDEFRRELLGRRWPGVPVYADVRDVGVGAARVDLVAGGFPCKGVSSAGPRNGFDHAETALWREQLRVIRELRPRYVLVENVADLLSLHRGELFGEVLGGLAESGYDAEWDCFPAAAFGAPHGRDRVFVTAVADATWVSEGGTASESRPDRERVGEGNHSAAADTASPRADTDPSGGRSRGAARERDLVAPADTGGVGRIARQRLRTGDESRVGRGRLADQDGEVAADADEHGRPGVARETPGRDAVHGDERHDADGRGVSVRWGAYESAVQRWEGIFGRPAPEPLIRRMDDGRTGRVERSRLSALGDGVLVNAGWLCGQRIMEHAMTLCESREAANSQAERD